MAQINFDSTQVPENNFDPVPAGDYMVWISESHIEATQSGGQQLKITMDVMQPEHFAGKKVFANFTLEGPNPKAAEVGRRILAGVCRAVGVMAPRDSEEMHNIPFNIRVEVKQLDSGKLVNDPKAYWSTQSAAPPQPKGGQKPPQAPGPRPGAQTGYMPQGQQPWQQPAQQAPQQQYAPPQQMSQPPLPLGPPQYRTGPIPGAPQQTAYSPTHPQGPAPQQYQQPAAPQAQAPQGAPPWTQPRPAAPAPQQAQQPEEIMYDENGNRIPF